MRTPNALALAPLLPAGAAAYSTVIALEAAGLSERPAHALGAVALLAYLTLLTKLIDHVTARRTAAAEPARGNTL